jgi:hypothetical protein
LKFQAMMPGGENICLGFEDPDGRIHRVVLPLEAPPGLLMTSAAHAAKRFD